MSGAPAMTSTLPTPGTYLRKRREAQALAIEDVAAFLRTDPHLDLHGRCTLLRGIEGDLTPISDDVIASLMRATDVGSFRFDPEVLVRLIDIAAGDTTRARPRLCDRCACSEYDPCQCGGASSTWTGCHWVEANLCSACASRPALATALDAESRAA